MKALAVESTLNTLREGNRTFVVNTPGSPVKLKQRVFLSRALGFNGQVIPEPVEVPHTSIGAVNHSPTSDKTTHVTPMSK